MLRVTNAVDDGLSKRWRKEETWRWAIDGKKYKFLVGEVWTL